MKKLLVFILIISMLGTALASCTGGTVINGTETGAGTDVPTQSDTQAPTGTDIPSEAPTTEVPTDVPSATVADTFLPDTFSDMSQTEDIVIDTQAPIVSDEDLFVTDAPTYSEEATEENITQSETEAEIETEIPTQAPTEKPTEAPTQAPVTQKPTEKVTEKPTEKPTFNVKESTKGLKFELNEDKLSYTLVDMGTASTKSEILIDGYNGLPVTKIGYGVFDNSIKKNTVLTKVTIGDYVEEIGYYAFSHCSKLTSVVMGDGVKVIKYGAFRYCTALTSIKLGKNVERIENSAFYKSSKLANISIPDTVKYIADYAFDNTAYYTTESNWVKNALYVGNHLIKLKSNSSGTVNVKEGTKSIAENALAGCTSVTKVVIPNSVVAIADNAFNGCTALATVSMGTGVKYIGEAAFANTKFYNTSSNWNKNVLYAGNCLIAAKTSCSGVITVASGTKAIASGAFASCQNVTGVMLPATVASIGKYAFLNCSGLTNVTIGKGIETIYAGAFKGCIKLTAVTLNSYTGWEVDGVMLTADELEDKADAAALLTSVYVESVWKH